MQATLESIDAVPVALGPLAMGAFVPDPALLFIVEAMDDEPMPADEDLDEVLALRCASL